MRYKNFIIKSLCLSGIFFSISVFANENTSSSPNFFEQKYYVPKPAGKEIAHEFDVALIKFSAFFEIKIPFEPIAILPMNECKLKKPEILTLSNVICYADWAYPAEKLYGLPRYLHNLKYYLIAKHLIYKNLHSRWYGLDAGQVKTMGRLINEDFISGISLLAQEMASGEKPFADENLVQMIGCHVYKHYNVNFKRANLYYIFLSQQLQKHPGPTREFIRYLLDKKNINQETKNFLLNLEGEWSDFKTQCGAKSQSTSLPEGSLLIKNYWPYSTQAFENIIDLQTIKNDFQPEIASFKIVNKADNKRSIKKLSRKIIKNIQLDSNETALIKNAENGSDAFLQTKKRTAEITIPERVHPFVDLNYSPDFNNLSLLTTNGLYNLKMSNIANLWLRHEPRSFPIKDISTLSALSLNEQALITVDHYLKKRRSALLWDVRYGKTALILKTMADTYSPNWTKNNKGILFIAKTITRYQVYYLDLVAKQYNLIFETDLSLPLISVASLDQNSAVVAAVAKKGTIIFNIDIQKTISSSSYEATDDQNLSETSNNIFPQQMEFKSTKNPSLDHWSFKLSPFIWSEVKGFLTGLKFDINRFDTSDNIMGTVGYSLDANDVELSLNINLDELLLAGSRNLEPLLTGLGWRDTTLIDIGHIFHINQPFSIKLAINYLNIYEGNISNQRYNLLGPSLELRYNFADIIDCKAAYSLLFLTSQQTRILHQLKWQISYEKEFPIVGIKVRAQGQNIFNDNQGILWGIAGGQLWPIFQDRWLTAKGFAKTSFYEPQLGTLIFEIPITVFKNIPPPVPGAMWSDLDSPRIDFLWWQVQIVPLGDIVATSQRNQDKYWSWSSGGELRASVRNSFFTIQMFSGIYYAGDPENGWTYNAGGGISW